MQYDRTESYTVLERHPYYGATATNTTIISLEDFFEKQGNFESKKNKWVFKMHCHWSTLSRVLETLLQEVRESMFCKLSLEDNIKRQMDFV